MMNINFFKRISAAFVLIMMTLGSVANAQERQLYVSEKVSGNVFIGVGAGFSSIINDGFNTPAFNFNISLGKLINPVFGIRGQIAGLWYSLDQQSTQFHDYCAKAAVLNVDAMVNLINLFGTYNPDRKFDFYMFGGPSLTVSRKINLATYDRYGIKMRVGASAGLGAAYSINEKWAVNAEGRLGVAPSIFGMASDRHDTEATTCWTLGATYTFGGKKFIPVSSQIDKDAMNDEINKYRSELAQAQADLAQAKSALANAEGKTVEITKEVQTAGTRAIFFKIGSAELDDYGKVNTKLAAQTLKANPDKKYKVAGYADKATGSIARNQSLSEMRAQAVYDALIAEGVGKEQLEFVGFGGKDNMFDKNYLNRVVILE